MIRLDPSTERLMNSSSRELGHLALHGSSGIPDDTVKPGHWQWQWHMVYCEGHRAIHKEGICWRVGMGVGHVYYTSALCSMIWWTMYIVLRTFTVSHCRAMSMKHITRIHAVSRPESSFTQLSCFQKFPLSNHFVHFRVISFSFLSPLPARWCVQEQ